MSNPVFILVSEEGITTIKDIKIIKDIKDIKPSDTLVKVTATIPDTYEAEIIQIPIQNPG